MQAILLDIEGTTTPVAFVYEVLFPYARQCVQEFLEQHWRNDEVRADLEILRREHAADASEKPLPSVWRDNSPEAHVQSAVAYQPVSKPAFGPASFSGGASEEQSREFDRRARIGSWGLRGGPFLRQ